MNWRHSGHRTAARWIAALLLLLAALRPGQAAWAETVTLKNGMVLEGSVSPIGSLGADPLKPTGPTELKQIILVDNQLTRTFVGKNQLAKELGASPAIAMEKILVPQRVTTAGRAIGGVGPIVRIDPFDQWGRRIFTMTTYQGNVDIVQGITEITPKWTKVESVGANSYVWSMRIATSSIPRQQLSAILYNVLDPKNPDQRLRIVQLYLQSERFHDARAELEQCLKEFPELAHLQEQVKVLRQLSAQRLLKEIELRRDAGQYLLAIAMLQQFPSEGVAGETLLKVREMLDEFAAISVKGQRLKQQLGEHVAALKDDSARARTGPIVAEILRDLNVNTLDRMADYLRLADDASLSAEQKLSLAISGWLLGSGSAIENLAVSQSLVEVRELVRKYLATTRQPERDVILQELTSKEGATQEYIAKIIAHMRPPLEPAGFAPQAAELGNPAAVLGLPPGEGEKPAEATTTPAAAQSPSAAASPPAGRAAGPDPAPPAAAAVTGQPAEGGIPGLLELTAKSKLPENAEVKYWVQLPPEYDAYRRYPCIVTLHGAGTTPLQQIDWWAGNYVPQAQTRYGQATRHGYIVIAPRWAREHQRKYEYSAREHDAVLLALRDASKRFAIDSDRVFLSGHSMGGDAAWDIGLSHPDLWAGVIPIVAAADKYVASEYRKHAEYLPLYFVSGEKDGDKLARNASEWDYYLKHFGYDTTVVQYQGRGHEHFHDEIQNLFVWMNLHRRDFFPKSFTVYSLRPTDCFFWWIETGDPKPANVVLAAEWDVKRKSVRAAATTAKVLATGGVSVNASTSKVTVWLSPELTSLDKPAVTIEGRRRMNVQQSVEILLEDVRTRGDRQHPFWAKVEN